MVEGTRLEQPDGVPLRSGANAEVTIDADLARDAAAMRADVSMACRSQLAASPSGTGKIVL